MDDSFAERLIKRLENQSGVGLVVWGVALTAFLSLLINMLDGASLEGWLEVWLSDLSTDLIAAGLAFLMIKAFLLRREQQAAPKETSLVVEQNPPTQPKNFTYFIEAEQVPVPNTATPAVSVAQIENAVENLEEALNELVAALKEGDTPEARQVHLDKFREKPIFAKSNLISINLQRAELQGVDFSGAQLIKANLREANLEGAKMQGANLKETQLIEADLQGADLSDALLEHTFLSGANLNGANLSRAKIQTSLWGVSLVNANLQDANLSEAELFKTNLTDANLQGANFEDAKFSTDMILPDGSHWNERTEIARFTDPTHAEFWKAESEEKQPNAAS